MAHDSLTAMAFPSRGLRLVCHMAGVLSWLLAVGAGLYCVVLVTALTIGEGSQQPWDRRIMAMAVLVPPLAGLAWGLVSAAGLFSYLRRGWFFSQSTADALRNFAIGVGIYKAPILLLWVAGLFGATMTTPDGATRKIVDGTITPLSFEGGVSLVLLGTIIVFASVMKRAVQVAEDAKRLAEENAQFI